MKEEQHFFTWHHFEAEIILLRVRWYWRYALSYRDFEEMLLECGCTLIKLSFPQKSHRMPPECYPRCSSCEALFAKALGAGHTEQDHRFIKRLVKPGMGFFSFQTAWNMLQGYESVHMLRKEQMYGIEKGNITGQISFIARLFGLVARAQSETRLTSIVPL